MNISPVQTIAKNLEIVIIAYLQVHEPESNFDCGYILSLHFKIIQKFGNCLAKKYPIVRQQRRLELLVEKIATPDYMATLLIQRLCSNDSGAINNII